MLPRHLLKLYLVALSHGVARALVRDLVHERMLAQPPLLFDADKRLLERDRPPLGSEVEEPALHGVGGVGGVGRRGVAAGRDPTGDSVLVKVTRRSECL